MPKFTPDPEKDESWWMNLELINPLGFDNEMCDDEREIKPGNWVACGAILGERYGTLEGYKVVFPTSTDCLYWVRWMLLPYECDVDFTYSIKDTKLFGFSKEMADQIDNAPDGINSEKLIFQFREKLPFTLKDMGVELYYLKSYEEFSSENF